MTVTRFVLFIALGICMIACAAGAAVADDLLARSPGMAVAGPDMVTYVGAETQFRGTAVNPDSMVVKYTWDFDGDGTVDYESDRSGDATHRFYKAGRYQAVFTAFIESGAALGPVTVNVEVVEGSGKQTSSTNDAVLKPLGLAAEQQFAGPAATAEADGYQERYVVIINGPSETRYWDNARYAYDMFHVTYGISDEKIYFVNNNGLAPDGTNPGNIIDTVATVSNLQIVFNTVAQNADADDIVIVWIVGHGSGYIGPVQRMASASSYYGYLGGTASVDPGDELDYLESDFKLRSYYMGGDYRGRYGLNEWKVYRAYKSSTETYYRREKAVSHFADQYIEKKGIVSDDDIYIERFIDYLAGDANKDGIIDTAQGEVLDYDGDGVPPYNYATAAFDEDDWGSVDDYYDNMKYISTLVPSPYQITYAVIDVGLDDRLDIDLDHDPANPVVNGTDFDNDGLFDGIDVNIDGDMSDWVSIDEEVMMYSAPSLRDDLLREMLAPIGVRAIVVAMEPCYSGGFIEDLSGPNRVLITAGEEETQTYTSRFIRNLTGALSGLSYPESAGDPALADTGYDGRVDMAEAFNFASSNDWGPTVEIPQYDDNGDMDPHTHFLPNGGDGDLGSTVTLDAAPDMTPPSTPLVTDAGSFTALDTELSASWSAEDPHSGIAEYLYQVRGDSPDGPVIVDWTSAGTSESVIVSGLTLEQGRSYYFAVKAQNGEERWSDVGYSDGIFVDTTAPEMPIVTDSGAATSSLTQLTAGWSSVDPESGIAEYRYKITEGSPVGPITRDWTSSGLSTSVTATGLALTPGTTYYFSVMAQNGSALWSVSGSSDGITVESIPTITVTAPNGGESWRRRSTYTIRWSYSENPGSYISIELLKGSSVDRTIASSTSVGNNGSGSYSWRISRGQSKGSDYRIRITSTTNGAVTDMSDSYFTIR